MEEKQLNFNQPFLSVRRHPPTVPSHKEDRTKSDKAFSVRTKPPLYRSELKSGPVTNPGTVPFIWEQTPGRPKEGVRPRPQNYDRPPIAPKLPPGRYPTANAKDIREDSNKASSSTGDPKGISVNAQNESKISPSVDETDKSFGDSKEAMAEQDRSDSGDSDEAYVDALDTLSRTESFFLNCSMSGVNGFEDLDVKQSGRFSTDQEAREFMMDRFLPAAKAMVTEAPQHPPKKQPFVREPPQERKKTVVNHVKPSLRYGPSFAKRYSYYQNNDEEEEEESDDEYDRHANFPSVCGLLPKFCSKSSLCILNPVPAMSVRTRMPTSASDRVKPLSSSSGSFSEMENESKCEKFEEPKPVHKIRAVELEENHTTLRNGSDQSQSHKALSTRDFRDSLLSFQEQKEAQAKKFGTKGFEPNGKGFKTFEELLAEKESPEELDCEVPAVEKTLYVDSEVKYCSPKTQGTEGVTGETEGMNQPDVIDSSLEDLEKSYTVDEDMKLLPNANNFTEFTVISEADESKTKRGLDMPKAFGENQNSNVATENMQVAAKEPIERYAKQPPRAKLPPKVSHRKRPEIPVPPPLPKSPSDSWLWRTLPSVSAKNSSLRSYTTMNPQNQCSKPASGEMKWESMVKSSKAKCKEDVLTPIPES